LRSAAAAISRPRVSLVISLEKEKSKPPAAPQPIEIIGGAGSQLRTGLRRKFPAKREITGNFSKNGGILHNPTSVLSVFSSFTRRFPYSIEQGMFSGLQGNVGQQDGLNREAI